MGRTITYEEFLAYAMLQKWVMCTCGCGSYQLNLRGETLYAYRNSKGNAYVRFPANSATPDRPLMESDLYEQCHR